MIQRDLQILRRNRRLERETRNLRERMDAGVSASRALRQNAFACDAFDRVAKRALNRRPLRLNLPAAKIGSVIGERDFEVSGYPILVCVVLMRVRSS